MYSGELVRGVCCRGCLVVMGVMYWMGEVCLSSKEMAGTSDGSL